MSADLFETVAVAVGFVACVTDIRTGRIPNLLTLGSAVVALVAHSVVQGSAGFSAAALGWIAGCALFFPFFLLGGMGAGDVKLLATLGAWLGARDVLWLAVYASLAGGVLAVSVALAHGYLTTALRNVWTLLRYWWYFGPRPMPTMTLDETTSPRIAYAVPIFIGTVAVLWL